MIVTGPDLGNLNTEPKTIPLKDYYHLKPDLSLKIIKFADK